MPEQTIGAHFLESALDELRRTKALAEKTIDQLSNEELHWVPDSEANSVVINVKYMAGNMRSRWTDFLTTDGEKPWRGRDDEFVDDIGSLEKLMDMWQEGRRVTFSAIEPLTEDDLLETVTVRQEPHTVLQAIHRQVSHYAYHVRQIAYIAKQLKAQDWDSLSIPKNRYSWLTALALHHLRA